MTQALYDISGIYLDLQQGALTLTANRRLAEEVLSAYAQKIGTTGRSAWPTPRVYSLSAWLQQCWQDLSDQGFSGCMGLYIMSPVQEAYLWRQALSACEDSAHLLHQGEAAALAQRAFNHLQLWQVAFDHPELGQTEDSQVYCQWQATFLALCQQQQCVTAAGAAAITLSAIEQGALGWSKNISQQLLLLGFESLPPLYQTIVTALNRCIGGQVRYLAYRSQKGQASKFGLENEALEILAAAKWAQQKWLQSPKQVAIAVVVPDLISRRQQVERIFSEVFAPQAFLVQVKRNALSFNISAGMPLSSTAPIFSALSLLSFNSGQMPLASFLNLLYSPFTAGVASEYQARLNLEAHLVKQGRSEILLDRLVADIEVLGAPMQGLLARLTTFQQLKKGAIKSRPPSRWAALFQKQLHALGWPGERALDSIEFQQLQTWGELLQSFAELDRVCKVLSGSEALSLLAKMAADTPFQPEKMDASLHILGTLEASGLNFTHLWVMGMEEQAWPQPPAPDPLIPMHLQRSLLMPHVHAARELAFAKALTENYLHSADTIIFSYPLNKKDVGCEPSPLISHLSAYKRPDFLQESVIANWWQQMAAPGFVTWHAEDQGPALRPDSPALAQLKGGSSILKHQSACPFQAFAIHRLHAAPAKTIDWGLNAQARGIVLHSALDHLWRKLDSWQNLCELSAEQKLQRVQQSVTTALTQIQQQHPIVLGEKFCELEVKRLSQLLTSWLELERLRPPFIIDQRESAIEVNFHGLPLRLRLDRIDRQKHDQHKKSGRVLIDYKSGNPKLSQWQGERLEDPQLPLYAVIEQKNQGDVIAVAFASLHKDHMGFKGIGLDDQAIAGVKQPDSVRPVPFPGNWSETLQAWEQSLRTLVEQFLAGQAAVDPKHPRQTCTHCHLASLCRIHELIANEKS